MVDDNQWFEDLDDETVLEVGYGILGRAQDIHDNPDDEHEDTAVELRDLAYNIIGGIRRWLKY